MSAVETRLAVPTDRPAIISTVVAAFAEDPAFRFFFADDYESLAPVFVGHLFDRRVANGTIWVDADADAVAMWDPPGAPPPPRKPPEQLEPVLERMRAYDEQVDRAVPEEPHWYLGILASHPRRRGEGLARSVVGAGLERARMDGVGAYLETANPTNVDLYERRGWRVVSHHAVGGLDVWVMIHDPIS